MVIAMMETSSTVTSTSFRIKDLLLRAWRERWSEIEWGRNIKRLLRGVSGDVYDLADCLLRQAINGPVTNNLLMLYLNHCLDSQIISFGACIMAITKIPDLKPQCMNSLLDFLLRYKTRTNCYGNDDECLALCRSLVFFLHWLYTIIQNSLNELNEYSSLNDHNGADGDNIHWQIVNKAIQMLCHIGDCSYLKALLYIGKMEEQSLWKQWLNLHQELISKLWMISSHQNNSLTTACSTGQNYKCSIEPFIDALQTFQNKIEWLKESLKTTGKPQVNSNNRCENIMFPSLTIATPTISVAFHMMTTKPEYGYISYRPLSYHSIRLLVSFYAILDPSCSNELLANYLAIIGRTFDLSLSKLYCETLHTCLVGLIDTHNLANEDRKNINYHAWIAFLLFKIPQIFLKLSQHRIQLRKERTQGSSNNSSEDSEYLTKTDLELGIDLLLEFGPCIDQFLLRYKTEHLQKLLDCFKESHVNLLSPAAVDRYMKEINRRMLSSSDSSYAIGTGAVTGSEEQSSNSNGNNQQQSQASDALSNILIFRAEHTVISILTPLYMESCNIEAVAGIICRMQHSFDIILCAAASNGILPKFAQRLMELNRTNINSRGEKVRSSQIRAVVFDITFISLCSLVERYGSEVIDSQQKSTNSSPNETSNSFFFYNWCRWNLPSSNACYAPQIILSSYKDQTKYDHLLQQLIVSNTSVEFRTSLVSWDEMCVAAQFATSEVLNAWIHDAISKDVVKIFLDRLKSRLCFLALSAACWLFAKLGTVPPEHQAKVMFMLNELQVASSQKMETSAEVFSNDASESNLAFGYKQRFLLMSSTLKRLLAKYVPHSKLSANSIVGMKAMSSSSPPIRLSRSPLNVLLEQCLHLARNHFTLKLIYDFDGLISLGGPRWFVTQIVKYLFNFNDVACLQDSVDLAYGLFHLDLEQCALILLKHTLPQFLLSKSSELDLIEPKISALVRLTVITTYSAIEQLAKFSQLNLSKRCGHRRNYQEIHELYPSDALEIIDNLVEHTPFYYKRRDHHAPSNAMVNDRSSQQNHHGSSIQDDHMDVDHEIDEPDDKWVYLDYDSKDYQWILKEPLYVELVNLFEFILQQSFDYEFSPWLLVPETLLEQIVLNLREDAPHFLRFISFHLLEAMTQSSHCHSSFEQLLAYLVLDSGRSRKIGAKLICQLQLSKEYVHNGHRHRHRHQQETQWTKVILKPKS